MMFCIPQIHQNLLSVEQLIEKGFKVIFENKHSLIKDVNDNEIFHIKMRDKSFSFDPLKEEQAAYPSHCKQYKSLAQKIRSFSSCSCWGTMHNLTRPLCTNALNNADSAMKRASSVYSKEIDQWLSSSEVLEVKKMELEIESQFMNETR